MSQEFNLANLKDKENFQHQNCTNKDIDTFCISRIWQIKSGNREILLSLKNLTFTSLRYIKVKCKSHKIM